MLGGMAKSSPTPPPPPAVFSGAEPDPDEVGELLDQETPEQEVAERIRQLIIAETSHGEFRAVEVAQRIVDKLRATDPDLLLAFLEDHAVRAITDAILLLDRQRKSRLRAPRKTARSVFAAAVGEHENGRPDALVGWLETWVEAGPQNAKVHLRDARAEHLDFAIGRYRKRAQSNEFEAVFLEAIRKKIGSKTVGESLTDEEIVTLRENLTRHPN